jgi:hypothetical protein
MRARTVRVVILARALRALDVELRRMVLCTERHAAQRHTQRHQRRRNNQRDALAHQVPPSSRLPPGCLTEVRKAQNECRLPSMSSFPFARGLLGGAGARIPNASGFPFLALFSASTDSHLLYRFPQKKTGPPLSVR